MVENSIISFKDCNSTGLDLVPIDSVVMNKTTGEMFQLTSKSASEVLDIFGDSSCRALYAFNGSCNDSSNIYNGTPVNVTYASGKFGQCGVFNGTSSYISIPSSITTGLSAISLSFWIKRSAITNLQEVIFRAGSNTAITSYFNTDNTIAFTFDNNFSIAGPSITDLNFHLITITKSANAEVNGAKIYVDGVLKNSVNTLVSGLPVFDTNLRSIGYSHVAPSRFINASLDQFRLFNKALTQAEVTTLYDEDLKFIKFCDVVGKKLVISNGNLQGVALFYGGYLTNNTLTVFTRNSTMSEINIGTGRHDLAGAKSLNDAIFFGGNTGFYSNTTTKCNDSGLKQAEVNIGTARADHGGAWFESSTNVLFYGGYKSTGYSSNTTLISNNLILSLAETSVGSARYGVVGSNAGINSLFYGGYNSTVKNTITILSNSATLVTAETYVGQSRKDSASSSNATILIYSGTTSNAYNTLVNTLTVLTFSGVLSQVETSIGDPDANQAGCYNKSYHLFYGNARKTLISNSYVMEAKEYNIGTNRIVLAGASF